MCILKQKMFIDVIINITPKTHDTERQTKNRHLRFELKNLIFFYFYITKLSNVFVKETTIVLNNGEDHPAVLKLIFIIAVISGCVSGMSVWACCHVYLGRRYSGCGSKFNYDWYLHWTVCDGGKNHKIMC